MSASQPSPLARAIDAVLSFVDDPAKTLDAWPSVDCQKFEAMSRIIYAEAHKVGLKDDLPLPDKSSFNPELKSPAFLGRVNLPGVFTVRGQFIPMPTGRWRDAMLTLRDLAEIATDASAKPTHSEDFTSVRWRSAEYRFAKGLQAESIRALWEAWENGTPSLSEKTIGEKAGSSNDRFRLEHVFKPSNKNTGKREPNSAWGTIIKPAGKGLFKLAFQ